MRSERDKAKEKGTKQERKRKFCAWKIKFYSVRFRVILSFIMWSITFILLILYTFISPEVQKIEDTNAKLKKQLREMIEWSETIKEFSQNGKPENILELVENTAKKYGIKLESARPKEDYFEITARGIDPKSMISFMTEMQRAGAKIRKISIRKNFADKDTNDFEISVSH